MQISTYLNNWSVIFFIKKKQTPVPEWEEYILRKICSYFIFICYWLSIHRDVGLMSRVFAKWSGRQLLKKEPSSQLWLRSPTLLFLCREEENLVFWFGAQFISTLNFTQSGWLILFSPDLHFRLAKRVSGQTHSLWLETATRTDVPPAVPT